MSKKTLVEKILASASGKKEVSPGEIVTAKIDFLMGHDGTASLCIDKYDEFKKLLNASPVFDKSKVLAVFDHFCPPATVERADIQKKFLDFVKREQFDYSLYEGICHQLLAEHPAVSPGKVILGADSHTVTAGALGAFATGVGSSDFLYALIKGNNWFKVPSTYKIRFVGEMPVYIQGKDLALEILRLFGESGAVYKALEYHDETTNKVSMDSRLTISNMSVETGAKAGIFNPDEITQKCVTEKGGKFRPVYADEDAHYEKEYIIDVSCLEPLIALPHSPANVKKVSEVEGIQIDQIYLGSCTGGRLEDLISAAKILKGHQPKRGIKIIVIPSSRKVYLSALQEGCLTDLIKKGMTISNPSCGPCCNIDKGLLGDKEKAVSTSNRNFPGRMGSYGSEVYLASSLTAAASSITGEITNPKRYLR
ncbi:MAG: aconitase/3-isopropylmalate dehydratase large subunit family protein [Candidatus Woesearchaeota archaeon]